MSENWQLSFIKKQGKQIGFHQKARRPPGQAIRTGSRAGRASYNTNQSLLKKEKKK